MVKSAVPARVCGHGEDHTSLKYWAVTRAGCRSTLAMAPRPNSLLASNGDTLYWLSPSLISPRSCL